MGRSRSDSSSSSSSSSSESSKKHKKHKKDKKDKKDKKGDKLSKGYHEGHSTPMNPGHQMPLMPEIPHTDFSAGGAPGFPQARSGGDAQLGGQPPQYQASSAPSSGYRVPLTTDGAFPDQQQAGHPPFQDLDGSPVFFGSALFPNSVHPCKIAPALRPPCRVPYGGGEHEHHGRYDLLPFDPNTMELVPTSNGQIPAGRRPVEGGYEDHGAKLYHGVAVVQGVKVPGKTGEHLGGCNVSFGGGEHVFNNYEILCWRY